MSTTTTMPGTTTACHLRAVAPRHSAVEAYRESRIANANAKKWLLSLSGARSG